MKNIFTLQVLLVLSCCKGSENENIVNSKVGDKLATIANSNDVSNEENVARNIAQIELVDSAKLTHIKGPFYKGKSGQLFERTMAMREAGSEGSLKFVEYFNGNIPQSIDPETFKPLDGWFAKDKNAAYYYRPTSGGMMCVKLYSVNIKYFRVVKGEYLYATDGKYVYKETEIIKKIY